MGERSPDGSENLYINSVCGAFLLHSYLDVVNGRSKSLSWSRLMAHIALDGYVVLPSLQMGEWRS
jgi:hypothetical protein